MAGIKTKDLDTVKTRILSDTNLRNDFDACVNLFQDFIQQKKSLSTPQDAYVAALESTRRSISALTLDQRHNNKHTLDEALSELNESTADMTIPDRYYTKAEYDNFTPEQKRGLKIKCLKCSHTPGSRSSAPATKRSRTVKAATSESMDDAPATTANSDTDTDSSDNSDEEVPMKPSANKRTTNRTNKALRRKRV